MISLHPPCAYPQVLLPRSIPGGLIQTDLPQQILNPLSSLYTSDHKSIPQDAGGYFFLKACFFCDISQKHFSKPRRIKKEEIGDYVRLQNLFIQPHPFRRDGAYSL